MIEATIASDSGRPLHATNRTAILDLRPDREIVAVDVERDLDILRMQMWPGWIVEPGHLSPGQDQPLYCPPIARSAFETITQMDRADFILVGALQTFLAHSD